MTLRCFLSLEGELNVCSWDICHCPTVSVSVGGRGIKKWAPGGWGKRSYHSLLAFSLDSQLCRVPAFMVLSGHSHLTLTLKGNLTKTVDESVFSVRALTVAVEHVIDRLAIFRPICWNVSCQSLSKHSWLFSLYSNTAIGMCKGA